MECEVIRVEDRNNGTGGRAGGVGWERDPASLGPEPDGRRHGQDLRSSGAGGHPEARKRSDGRGPSPWVNWQSALYVFVLGWVCLVLVPLTSFWWIVPVLGALVPVALAMLDRPDLALGRSGPKKAKERELLGALAEGGEITPATAAMRTSLTVEEASKMLEGLAGKGHLKLQDDDGMVAYVLPDRGRPAASGASPEPVDPGAEVGMHTERLDDPLSERELEVLTLLASGRTNAEIARDLFVALGTVKSHVNNVYRKLGVANRTEAVTRARELRLLR